MTDAASVISSAVDPVIAKDSDAAVAVINDGWKSRNFWLTIEVITGMMLISGTALFLNKCTAAEFFSFWTIFGPAALAIFAGKTVMEKRIGQ